jgi:hypothetical protein
MPRGTKLSDVEQGQILALKKAGLTSAVVGRMLGRTECVVNNFLRRGDTYGTVKRSGRPPRMNDTAKRRLIREATKGKSTCRRLVADLNLPVGKRRVQQLLQGHDRLVYKKRKSSPKMTKAHEIKRVQFAQEQIANGRNWDDVIFSDEKKLNADGPDGCQYYWHHLDHDEQVFSKRQSGGPSVMIWGAFSCRGKSELHILEGVQDSYQYTMTLGDYLMPFAHANHGLDFVFQQDNASIHTSRETKEWLIDQEIDLLPHPAKSPDLNPIENLWAIIVRRVYDGGRQFPDKQSLTRAIVAAWEEISIDQLKKLVKSMPNRCAEVLKQQGKKTRY